MNLIARHLTMFTIIQQVARGKECGHPGEPANGTLMSTEILFYPGEEVVYNCKKGFLLTGKDKRTCEEDGRWSGFLPNCKENLALLKPATQSDVLWSYRPDLAVDGDPNTCSFTTRQEGQRWWQVSLNSHPVVESVWVTMSPGAFQKFAIFVVEILDGNTAEYKPCAQFEGRFHEQQAKFKCNEGSGQLGQFVYIRDDRVDREYFGLCEVQVFQKRELPECGRPESPVYSSVNPVGPSSVEYSCIQGYILTGNKRRNCTDHGWEGGVPMCQEVKCDHPTSTKDGFIEVSNFRGSYVFGSRATYHCNPGFILWGNSTRLCDSTGQWTGLAPRCRPISCGDPPMLPHSAVALLNGSTQWKSLAVYSCLPGYTTLSSTDPRSESICQENGSWSLVDLSCIVTGMPQGQEKNVFYVEGGRPGQATISSGTLTIIGILAAVILGTAVLTTFLLVKKWLCKHIYYPAGSNLVAEKPLIYDKVENHVNNGMDVSTASSTYQTTNLTTFRQSPDSSTDSTSPSSNCSALSDKRSAQFINNTKFLNTYASLPRPSKQMGFRYAEASEVTNHSLIHGRKRDDPEYANLVPWSQGPPPLLVHYATLGRAPHTKKLLLDSKSDKLCPSESIPDILQTLSIPRKVNKANVIVNELSGIEDLVDLGSPEKPLIDQTKKFSHSYISVKHSNIDDNI